jgi:hypothetical protein
MPSPFLGLSVLFGGEGQEEKGIRRQDRDKELGLICKLQWGQL